MAGKKGGMIPRPIAKTEWTPKFGNNSAAKHWREMANSKLKSGMIKLWEMLVADPRESQNPDRHHQLKGDEATKIRGGVTMEHWQYEISGGGRIWFLIDDDNRTVWVTVVSAGHPSKTDK